MKMRTNKANDEPIADLVHAVTKWRNTLDPVAIWPSCASCHFLMKDDRTCEVFKAQPPVSVVVKGCARYSDKLEIPY